MPTTDPLRTAENELQKLRLLVADFVGVIHDPAYDYDTRRAIAQRLGLPEPATPKGAAQ
ncbi:hypothetical protein [Streptomyces olivaceoviridis]|uniref:hypothetical protein n=1 Tax=Streptomyces olivaceoviridis TaxID=1921 RepID=UPI0036842E14